jgi:hypothetical protein
MKEILEGGSTGAVTSLRTSDKVSPLAVMTPFEEALLDRIAVVVCGIVERTRFAQDVGFGRGGASTALTSAASSAATLEDGRLASGAAVGSSEALEWDDTTESRWVLRAAEGLAGSTGTTGTTGWTGRLLTWVGVSWDFIFAGGAGEEGVVGWVDTVSEGASEVSGVGVCIDGASTSKAFCLESASSPTLAVVVSAAGRCSGTGTGSWSGYMMGSLASCERRICLRRRGARGGNASSCTESQGVCKR